MMWFDEQVAADDRSFLYGDGLFETVRVHDGHVRWLPIHLQRLQESGAYLGFHHELIQEAQEALRSCTSRESGIWRMTVTRQHEPVLWGGTSNIRLRFRPWRAAQPLAMVLMDDAYLPGDVMLQHKTTSYIRSIMAKRYAASCGVEDVIRCSRDGYVGETSCANVFAFVNGQWLTPPVDGLLNGVTRKGVLMLLASLGSPAVVAPLPRTVLESATEVMVTSAVHGVRPVVQLGDTILFTEQGTALQRMVAKQ